MLAEEHHAEAVDAEADAARRGQAVFEGDEEILLMLLAAGLVLQRCAPGVPPGKRLLQPGPASLCEQVTSSPSPDPAGRRGHALLPVDAALEDFHRGRVVGRELGQRHEVLRQMR